MSSLPLANSSGVPFMRNGVPVMSSDPANCECCCACACDPWPGDDSTAFPCGGLTYEYDVTFTVEAFRETLTCSGTPQCTLTLTRRVAASTSTCRWTNSDFDGGCSPCPSDIAKDLDVGNVSLELDTANNQWTVSANISWYFIDSTATTNNSDGCPSSPKDGTFDNPDCTSGTTTDCDGSNVDVSFRIVSVSVAEV